MSRPTEIRAAYLKRGVNVERYAEDVRRRTTGFLESLVARIYSYLLTADLATVPKRERAIKRITDLFVQHYASAEDLLSEAMVELVRDESRFFKTVFGPGGGKVLLKREAQALVAGVLIDGTTLHEWLISQAMGNAQKVSRIIRLSPVEATREALVTSLFGRNTGKFTLAIGPNGKPVRAPVFLGEGFLQTARRHLNTVAKSAVHAAQQSADLASATRAKKVAKLQLSVILDQRTSVICNSRAGSVWYADSGKPAPESGTSESFPGPPPYHLNCRSLLIPYEEELPPDISLSEWISSLPKAEQRQILGNVRYNRWREGKLDLDKLSMGDGRPLTIEQLRDSY